MALVDTSHLIFEYINRLISMVYNSFVPSNEEKREGVLEEKIAERMENNKQKE